MFMCGAWTNWEVTVCHGVGVAVLCIVVAQHDLSSLCFGGATGVFCGWVAVAVLRRHFLPNVFEHFVSWMADVGGVACDEHERVWEGLVVVKRASDGF